LGRGTTHQVPGEHIRRCASLQTTIESAIVVNCRAASCRQSYVKRVVSMVNSIYNGWRFEDLWLDK
jgi:peptide/nickel transport system substrate-binding protein